MLKRYHRRSASKLAARRRRSAADAIRRPDAGIESEKNLSAQHYDRARKRRKTSAGIIGTTEGSWPGVGDRSAADAIGRLDASENVEASSTEIGRRNQTGGARRSVRRRRAARFARRAPRARPSPAPSRRDGAAGSRLAGVAAIGGGAARLVSARGRRRSLAARFPSASGSKQQAGRRSQVSSRPAAPSFSKNKVSVPARLLRVLFVIFQVSRSKAAAQERVRGP